MVEMSLNGRETLDMADSAGVDEDNPTGSQWPMKEIIR
jgi:hypothetical protein